jgi:hypothetical protein
MRFCLGEVVALVRLALFITASDPVVQPALSSAYSITASRMPCREEAP